MFKATKNKRQRALRRLFFACGQIGQGLSNNSSRS